MGDLVNAILRMHKPSLHRVPIPGIIQDAPACTECRKAHPCPTYKLAMKEKA